MNTTTINFLQTFFILFHATIENVAIEGSIITGIVKWKGKEDTQAFSWNIPSSSEQFPNTVALINYLSENNLVSIDKIIISEDSLISRLKEIGWDSQKINTSLHSLCSINVPMVDNGERTDSFFIHF
jgi:hypothetical protein